MQYSIPSGLVNARVVIRNQFIFTRNLFVSPPPPPYLYVYLIFNHFSLFSTLLRRQQILFEIIIIVQDSLQRRIGTLRTSPGKLIRGNTPYKTPVIVERRGVFLMRKFRKSIDRQYVFIWQIIRLWDNNIVIYYYV